MRTVLVVDASGDGLLALGERLRNVRPDRYVEYVDALRELVELEERQATVERRLAALTRLRVRAVG